MDKDTNYELSALLAEIDSLRAQLTEAQAHNARISDLLCDVGEQLGYPYGEVDQSIPFATAIASLQTQLTEAQNARADTLKELYRVRPLADCYQRVCQSLGIEKNLLSFAVEWRKKAEALDRLEEMKGNLYESNGRWQVETRTMRTHLNFTPLRAITAAWEASR